MFVGSMRQRRNACLPNTPGQAVCGRALRDGKEDRQAYSGHVTRWGSKTCMKRLGHMVAQQREGRRLAGRLGRQRKDTHVVGPCCLEGSQQTQVLRVLPYR